jgi:hypothetical protein
MHWRGRLVSTAFVYVAGDFCVLRVVEFLPMHCLGCACLRVAFYVHVCVTVPLARFSLKIFVHFAWTRKDSITMSMMWIVLL